VYCVNPEKLDIGVKNWVKHELTLPRSWPRLGVGANNGAVPEVGTVSTDTPALPY